MMWLSATHPLLFALVLAVTLVIAVTLIVVLFKFLRAVGRKLGGYLIGQRVRSP
jgi:hypothetical protein